MRQPTSLFIYKYSAHRTENELTKWSLDSLTWYYIMYISRKIPSHGKSNLIDELIYLSMDLLSGFCSIVELMHL